MSKVIPTYLDGEWTTTEFKSDEDLAKFVLSIFKEPGKYNFDETSFLFNSEARKFNTQGFYCSAPFRSKDFMSYWDDQKNKCRNGVIYLSLIHI